MKNSETIRNSDKSVFLGETKDGKRYRIVRDFCINAHDLWCYRIRKSDNAPFYNNEMVRVYLGSKNIKPDNVEWLDGMTLMQ